MSEAPKSLNAKDFASDQDIRWCPGCGDFAILKQMQLTLPKLGIPKEDIVFISGIGCSSRFPYYMNTYGMHSIHGRATAIASGLRALRKDLSIWIVTGDGDALSIGGNHLIHLLRRNFNVNILLFNNEIYGLTKGQYSPTSKKALVTKSSPLGSLEDPFNPMALALGADASFVARTADREAKHMQEIFKRSHAHKGTSLIEIYQNCHIFNDGAFKSFTDRGLQKESVLFLNQGEPLLFGENNSKGIILDGYKPKLVDMDQYSPEDLWVHEENDLFKAQILSRFLGETEDGQIYPRPFGVTYQQERPTYDDLLEDQMASVTPSNDMNALIAGDNSWTI